MVEIEIATARETFSALLELAEHGEEVVILRDGDPVARLSPNVTARERAESDAAFERIRERAKTLPKQPFDWEEIKADRDFGRR